MLGFVTDIAILGTCMCYDRGRDAYGVSYGNYGFVQLHEDTHVLRQRTWCVLCYLREHLSVIAPISGDTLVSGVVTDIGGTHMYYDRGPCCVTCGVIVDNEAFIVFAAVLVTYSLL